MPRYFFDIFNAEVVSDEEGIPLADDREAMRRAVIEARELAAESVRNGHLVGSHRVEVLDEQRERIGVVRFDEAVAIS